VIDAENKTKEAAAEAKKKPLWKKMHRYFKKNYFTPVKQLILTPSS
jgi:hypothetical protein